MDKVNKALVSTERDLDLRVGEPTFFYIMLENPHENIKNRRTFTIQICG